MIEKSIRVIAIDTQGKQYIGGSTSGIKAGVESMQTTFNLPLEDVNEFQFQTRPYEWVEFKNVSLKPNVKTDVQIKTEKPAGQGEILKKNLVWGETGDGLRAAVELLPEKEEYAIGEQIGIRFYIQNDSNRVIQFTTGNWRDDGITCVAQDNKGNKIFSRSILYTGMVPIQRKILLPGQIVTLESATLYLAADEKQANSANHPVGNVLILKPGHYSLWYQLDFPDVRSTDSKGKVNVPQPGDWQGLLNTGKHRFIVANQNTLKTPPETKTD